MLDSNNIVAVKIAVDDLLPLSQISLLRAGDYEYYSNELEIDTFNKLNNTDYRWVLDTLINSFFTNQIKTSYDAVKDSTWPDVSTIEDFERLPERIKQECIEVHKLELLELNENNPNCPRRILREFFQIGFMNPTNHCFITQQRNMVYAPGTKIYDFGTQGKQPVNIIDFQTTDALSTINGTTGYGIDGYTFIDGSRVIFANDSDPQVRNKIYVVEFIVPDTVPPLIAEPIINLVPANDSTVLVNDAVVCLSGNVQQGKSYWYDGVVWTSAQQKTKNNQAPLFDVYDSTGISYGDKVKYPSTNFAGCKLFSYAIGSGANDIVLGFPLKYLSLTNIGDIVFDNYLYTDTFVYTKSSSSSTVNVSNGYVRQYSDRTNFIKEIEIGRAHV